MVGIFIANTDNDWYDFLSRKDREEVNFWKPSPTNSAVIQEGELLVFRLKSPRNVIGGFGVLSSSSILPIQMAWEAFGEGNGTSNLSDLVSSIARFRSGERIGPTSFIGCRILTQPLFLPPHLWFDLPESWSRNIVGGKRFSTDTEEGRTLWERIQQRTALWSTPTTITGLVETGARYGEPALIMPRLGQGAFRIAVVETYERQCALTGGKVLPALEAAHIRPYAEGGSHSKSNGILLRKDVHSVFDAGYATIDESYRFVVSDKVRDVFQNGNEYRRLHGVRVRTPSNPRDHPALGSLRWHNENRFLG